MWIEDFTPMYKKDEFSIRLSDDPTVGWELYSQSDLIMQSTDFMKLVESTGFPFSDFNREMYAQWKLEKSLHLLFFDTPIVNFCLVGNVFECFVRAYEFGFEIESKESIIEAKKWCEERYDFYFKKLLDKSKLSE